MLEKPHNRSRIECATILLDEVIAHLEENKHEAKVYTQNPTVISNIDPDLSQEAQDAKEDLMQ